MDLYRLALVAALLGLLCAGAGAMLVDPTLRLVDAGNGLSLMLRSPSTLPQVRAMMGVVFALPALVLWEGSLVYRLRNGRLPDGATLVLLFALPAMAVAAGLLARGLFLAFVLPQFALVSGTVSLETLELPAWALRAGLAARILAVAWVGLRRS